jgi:hypothetical protein
MKSQKKQIANSKSQIQNSFRVLKFDDLDRTLVILLAGTKLIPV